MNFQLLAVEVADKVRESDGPVIDEYPRRHVIFENPSGPMSINGTLTALIGKNGTGKSHLLRSVAEAFILIEDRISGKRRTKGHVSPVRRIAYRIGPRHCLVKFSGSRIDAYLDGLHVELIDLPRPNRVVALSTSPFDKFPIVASLAQSATMEFASAYQYLGLRDRSGKAAVENLLFRSLNILFEKVGNQEFLRANIDRIFEFLELEPKLTVVYTAKIASNVAEVAREGGDILNDNVIKDTRTRGRVMDLAAEGDLSREQLNQLLSEVLVRREGQKVRFDVDLRSYAEMDSEFVKLQLLRKAGFLQLSSVEISKRGRSSDIGLASSGQVSIVASLLSLASVIESNSLILIDEPELSLHPEWQIQYVNLLLETFGNYSGCHFVIATHSPLIISKLPPEALIVSLDNKDVPPLSEMAGQSSDVLLAEAFGLPSANNLYVKERILDALQLAADGEAETQEFQNQLRHLEGYLIEMDAGDPARVVIEGLREVAIASRGAK